jgi:hypothetical protein
MSCRDLQCAETALREPADTSWREFFTDREVRDVDARARECSTELASTSLKSSSLKLSRERLVREEKSMEVAEEYVSTGWKAVGGGEVEVSFEAEDEWLCFFRLFTTSMSRRFRDSVLGGVPERQRPRMKESGASEAKKRRGG